ncbi:MAG: lytic transglycosylase domain-containing protein [Treponema sp.]|uniref:transglycosylase SLT domain-containing protein n=1 Tax=Treponema sp. TaxID=166 RepID=UPI00298D8F33|nr:transglycosylase SLT domain-containing protein [Treponema sp.]MCQ2602153.1 lytic transglycosylase domain-containing protein [Treponema sp.]
MQSKEPANSFANTCFFAATLSVILIVSALLIYFLLPNKTIEELEPVAPITIVDLSEETEEELSAAFQDYFAEVSLSKLTDGSDDGLTLYRQPLSRSAVEWFYYQITGNKDVTQAIITEAEKNDIPLSLAFALAHTESSYNANATNKNSNATVDRGLFQLNSNSFPNLTEADFFDPFVSSKYGMSHLKFCLNTAGNEVSALAMYNAGTGRVRSNKTPQSTLNYVGKIMAYQKMLDQLFTEQVAAYFENQLTPGIAVAYMH